MEIIDQIRGVSSLVEIASQYTTLKRRGRKLVGLCPFHTEKTPSFTVDEEKQLFHCFGCGIGGDVFSLVMEKENLSFPEALKSLAERYHIPLPQQKVNPQALKLEEKLFKINEMALGFFRKNLFNTQEGRAAMEYLHKRKFSEDTIQALKIGYAMNSWDSLYAFFKPQNISATLLENAGLILAGKKRGEYYDRFRARIIFPIFSLTGKIVAFGGRTVINAEPKYLNSPETPLYSKGKLLYGLDISKDAVREAGEVILVEGYTDYASLRQAGIPNVVASLGTALTVQQVAQAVRFASRMIINYDGDSAGMAACIRAIPLCLEKGMNVQVLILPENLDPDGFLKKHGRDRYLALIKKSVPGFKFLIDRFSRGVKMDVPEEKAKVVRAVVKEIEKVPDAVVRSEYIKRTSEYFSVNEETIRNIIGHKAPDKGAEEKDLLSPAEKRLFQILFSHRELAPRVFSEIKEADFLGLKSEPAFRLILENFRSEKEWSFPDLKERIEPALAAPLSKAIFEADREASIQEALDCLYALRKISLQNRLKALQSEIVRVEKRGEKEKLLALLYEKQDVTKQILAI